MGGAVPLLVSFGTGLLSRYNQRKKAESASEYDQILLDAKNNELKVSIAGRTVQSAVNIEYGMRREIAYNAPTYTPITMSFLCSGIMKEKDILDQWNNMIVDPQKGFDVAYYDEYVGEMSVHVLGRDGKTDPYHIHYHEVYPKTVAAVEMNHATTNSTMRVTAEMAYSYWTTKSIKYNNKDVESKGNKVTTTTQKKNG